MMRFHIIAVLAIALLWACKPDANNEFMTASGVRVTVFSEGSEFLKNGNLLKIQADSYTADGGQILKTSTDDPMLLQYQQGMQDGGLLQEVLDQLKVGDSVQFEIPAGDLYRNTFEISLPDSLDEDQTITFSLVVEDQITLREYRREMIKKEMIEYEDRFQEEQIALDSYVRENDIPAKKTESGLHYLILQEGQGEPVIAGDSVTVNYTGYLLDGSSFGEGAFSFLAGQGQVIAGWDEAILLLSQGSKAKLFVPSKLAYASSGAGEIIPPFATLIFDVEVLEIKKRSSI